MLHNLKTLLLISIKDILLIPINKYKIFFKALELWNCGKRLLIIVNIN